MSHDFEAGLKTAQIRRRRGWILRILRYFREVESREINDKIIQDGLRQNGHDVSMPVLVSDLLYLEERGYVRLVKTETDGFSVYKAWITAGGMDLVEDVTSDPGIHIKTE